MPHSPYWREREVGHPRAELGRAHHNTSIQAQHGSDQAKTGPRGVGPGERAPGARSHPPQRRSGPTASDRLHSMYSSQCGGRFTEPRLQEAGHCCYIRRGNRPNTNIYHLITSSSHTPCSTYFSLPLSHSPSLFPPHSTVTPI
jgi:hypothetical protein